MEGGGESDHTGEDERETHRGEGRRRVGMAAKRHPSAQDRLLRTASHGHLRHVVCRDRVLSHRVSAGAQVHRGPAMVRRREVVLVGVYWYQGRCFRDHR